MAFRDIVPYTCVHIDACWTDIFKATQQCAIGCSDRSRLISDLQRIWMTKQNPNHVLPILSVRTGLDLYLRLQNFPQGSEVILSAINIPQMVQVVHHHGLRVVSLDIDLDTMAPKYDLLESLITEKTVAILVAHIYGKWFDMEPFIQTGVKYNLKVIEDCAEGFHGFKHIGHSRSDISLFSFGPIKYYTAFGGGIAKIRDKDVYEKISELYNTYPEQSRTEYLQKVLKYSFLYILLNCPKIIRPAMYLSGTMGIDHKKHVVNLLRGFPANMVQRIRYRPSTALLYMLRERLANFKDSDMYEAKMKAEYVADRLPESVIQVGMKADIRNFWLFPIIVENPDEVLKALNVLGIDAYRGATQLNIVEPDNGNDHLKHLHTFVTRYPHQAKFFLDHVIYLPVNRTVPFVELDKICAALEMALKSTNQHLVSVKSHEKVKLTSKL